MSHEAISSTAHVIAHIRSFTKIPYAGTIAQLSNAREKTAVFHHRGDFDIDLDGMRKLAPWIDLRFRSLHYEALYAGTNDFVELASGLSPGGMIKTEHADLRYLEVDLPDMIAQKKRIAGQLVEERKNLMFAGVSVLDGFELTDAINAAFPEGKEVAVLNEGLLQYLTRDEKIELARTIYMIVWERGGCWLTPDIVFKDELQAGFEQSEKSQRVRQIMAENTGRDMVELAFHNETHAVRFFQEMGFNVRYSWHKIRNTKRQRLWHLTPTSKL